MQSPNGMDRQPNEERLADAARYMKGKIKKKIKGKISLKARCNPSTNITYNFDNFCIILFF